MFFKTLLSTMLLAASTLATDHKGIPSAFTKGFQPEAGLQIEYTGFGEVTDGQDLTGIDTSKVPKFRLGDSSGINTSAKFIVLMLDPDVSGSAEVSNPQRLHYLRTDFSPNGEGVGISSQKAPDVKYVGSEATPGANGVPSHRYVFLLYQQPKDFVLKGVTPDGRENFDVAKWRELNGLKPAIAGVHFTCTVKGGAAAPPAMEYPKGQYAGGSPNFSPYPPKEETTPCNTVSPAQPTKVYVPPVYNKPPTYAPPAPPVAPAPPIITPPSLPSGGKTHKVIVGGQAGLVYTPDFVNAAIGDVIEFDFLSVNHTVTQSTFDSPCVAKPGGAKSGFRPNPESIPGKEIYRYTVEGANATWWYCAQGPHCQRGMVFAINPGPAEKLAAFKAKATGGAAAPPPPAGGAPPAAAAPSPGAPQTFTGAASGLVAKATGVLMAVAVAVALNL